MKNLGDRLIELKDKCLRCWAAEFGDIFPRGENTYLASLELKKYGNPECFCNGVSKKEFNGITELEEFKYRYEGLCK